MQLSSSEISDILKLKIEKLNLKSDYTTKGIVVSVADGIVRIFGLTGVMQGEMILLMP